MSAILEVEGLSIAFGGLKAVDDVDLTVEEGEIVSIIGPNGAGKTTFFNMLTGLLTPDAGRIVFEGVDIAGWPADAITRQGVARTFQNVRLFPDLTILENVMVGRHGETSKGLFSALLSTPGFRKEEQEIEEHAKRVLGFFGKRLVGFRFHQKATMLSYANRRRLEIARAMATSPRLICLDEPVAGMNPMETQELTSLIQKLRSDWGFTVLIIEHDMNVVGEVSDRVVVLDHGIKIAEGDYQHVSSDPQVIEAYLGRPVEGAKHRGHTVDEFAVGDDQGAGA
jgi:ABC-type branched-subunit amino acid transport system ATPase component